MGETKINEDFLQFIWKHKLFSASQVSSDGIPIEIVSVGFQNHSSGPDFKNASIRKQGIEWNGNVEIHLKSSDWIAHKHHLDSAYNSVILHVVKKNDRRVYTQNGAKIICLELDYPIEYETNYKKLMASTEGVNCENYLSQLDKKKFMLSINRYGVERLERKAKEILLLADSLKADWRAAYYISLSKYLSGNLNPEAYEILFRSFDVKILDRNIDKPKIVEAILYGQAGMLVEDCDDLYFKELHEEFQYQRIKYNLQPINPLVWRFMRVRPSSFPTVRLSQLSKLIINKGLSLDRICTQKPNSSLLIQMMRVEASSYWDEHYRFGVLTKSASCKRLGNSVIATIIINSIAPYLFAYAMYQHDEALKEYAKELLVTLPPEANKYTKYWNSFGFQFSNAFQTQSMLQLTKEYCHQNRCVQCSIGTRICIQNRF